MSFQSSGGTSSQPIANPFTQSWIQALTQAAEFPATRTIKAKLEWIDSISLNRPDVDRLAAAQELWDFAEAEGLGGLLQIVPTNQSTWVFDREDIFLYERSSDSLAELKAGWNFDKWTQAIGLQPTSTFSLIAEVTSVDWMGLVRSEAVRLRQSLNTAAVTQTSTMHLPCTARWINNAWTVQFDQLDWIVVSYEDSPTMPHPALETLEQPLMQALAHADKAIAVKDAGPCSFSLRPAPWMGCVDRLQPLHNSLIENNHDFSPWLMKTWNCVWPVVYKEQNVLKGLADLDTIRREIKTCLEAQPRLTVWMFLFAKLVTQMQAGRGLGLCADFVD
jgi:hypothetical protein